MSAKRHRRRHGGWWGLPALLGMALLAPLSVALEDLVLPEDFEAILLPTAGILFPIDLEFAPDGSLYVLQKAGLVRFFDTSEQLQSTPVIDMADEVNNSHDRGLLGLALHPGFVPDGGPTSWMYLLYTVSPVPGEDLSFNQNDQYSFSRLTRLRVMETDGVVAADLGSRQVLLGHQRPDGAVPDAIASVHDSHSNGALKFADDGSLVVSIGDGARFDRTDIGGFDDPAFDDWIHPQTGLRGPTPAAQDNGAFRSQDLDSLAGKLLRIDPRNGHGYASNPFFTGNPRDNASRVWALGLRNPFSIALFPGTGAADPSLGQPNDMVIGDVGWRDWEELCLSRNGGENFGWPCTEGLLPVAVYQAFDPGDPGILSCATSTAGVATAPAISWNHKDMSLLEPAGVHQDEAGASLPGFVGGCVIGGVFYTGGGYPAEYGMRLFTADWLEGWIRTVEFDKQGAVVAVRDFATGAETVGDLAIHPVSGDVYWSETNSNRIVHLRYAPDNATPVAIALADPGIGGAPLAVTFTGSDSFDPDRDPISFDWDFGDSSPHATIPDPSHVYTLEGVYTATLEVTDPGGLTGTTTVPVFVGDAPIGVSILSPAPGQTYVAPTSIQLQGFASDPGAGAISYEWRADFFHDTHVHPGAFSESGREVTLPLDTGRGPEGELFYYRIELTATNDGGLSDSAHLFLYPEQHVVDVTGTATPITQVQTLTPPFPLGSGNPDPEVLRDGTRPRVGAALPDAQYDSFHNGDQGSTDWLGYELPSEVAEARAFVALEFQEGMHFADGGWWLDLHVDVRDEGTWQPVDNLSISPAYPTSSAADPFFDGVSFQTYRLDFDPTHGDAIRLAGTPGGTSGYVSAGELRVFMIQETLSQGLHADISEQGMIIARIFELSPPGPQGIGNPDVEIIRNGTLPPVGSASTFAQFDTFHGGDQGDLDWIGYEFSEIRTISRLQFQEGQHFADGGAFVQLGVEIQQTPNGPWMPATGLSITPAYPGLDGLGFESFTLDIDPTLARAVRVSGPPAGTGGYISVGELRVLQPNVSGDCGWSLYGENLGGTNLLTLDSPTPAALGLPIVVRATGALGPGPGFLIYSAGPSALAFEGGTFLVDPTGMFIEPVFFDSSGSWSIPTALPPSPELEGVQIALQTIAYDQTEPPVLLSNGLLLELCSW